MSDTILVVAGDAVLREFTKAVLQSYGYKVIVASGVDGASDIAVTHPGPIHLVVTDLNPGPNGAAFPAELTGARPNLRFLYLFGHKQDDVVLRALGPRVGLLHKLFVPMSLARKVRDLIERSRADDGREPRG
jgi:DNA-binding response OmpR family regulator